MKRSFGFTLIELIIAVVIVGILTAIALPSYRSYIVRAARTECKGVMLDMAQNQERYYTNNGTYLNVVAPPATPANFQNYSGADMASRKYDITVGPGTIADNTQTIGAAFTISATPSNGFADSLCGTLKLDSTGAKSSNDNTQCW